MTKGKYIKAVDNAAENWAKQYKEFDAQRVELRTLAKQYKQYKKKTDPKPDAELLEAIHDLALFSEPYDDQTVVKEYIDKYLALRGKI